MQFVLGAGTSLAESRAGMAGAPEQLVRLLDAQGEALQSSNPAQALLAASEHLLAWAKTEWAELANYGLNKRFHFLWL